MGRRWRFWPLTGFLTAAVLGTLAHFAYRWSGGALLAGVFCAVNESVWEHMKLLFFPVFLFTAAQFCVGERDGLLAARAVSVTAGLALIPTLYYTYTGVWGDHVLWADAAIFYLSAAVTFWMDDLLHRQRRLWKMGCQVAGLVWLWVLFLVCAVLCVIVYFSLTKEDDGLTKAQRKELKATKKAAAKGGK